MVIVSLPFLYYNYLASDPNPQTGFYCNDETIALPYKNDTVSFHTALTFGLSAPLLIVIAVEMIVLPILRKSIFFPFVFVSIIQLYFSRKFYHWVWIGNVEDRHRLFIWCSCQCQSGWNCQIHYWKIAASLFRRLQTGFRPNWMWNFPTAELYYGVHMLGKWSVISNQGTYMNKFEEFWEDWRISIEEKLRILFF